MVDHASGIESAGPAAHNVKGIVFPVVNMAVDVEMAFPVAVPLTDREVAQADFILSICDMAHFFDGFKIAESNRVA